MVWYGMAKITYLRSEAASHEPNVSTMGVLNGPHVGWYVAIKYKRGIVTRIRKRNSSTK